MKQSDIRKLTLSAVMLSLATVLSYIKVVQMPLGGSVTLLSMVPIAIIGYMLDIKWGFGVAFVYSLIQFYQGINGGLFSWGLTPAALVGAIAFDYILPYTVLGFSGIFRNKGAWGLVAGVALAVFLRFGCHLLSGAIIFDIWCEWDSAWLYSFCYNGLYMLPEMVLTCIGTLLLSKIKPFKKLFVFED